jgi:two-component system, NarL family, response regulator LiaR
VAAQSARILIVDDHGIVRDGLCAILERDRRFIVIGTATNGREAITHTMTLRPDVNGTRLERCRSFFHLVS